jgi:hypothetical protein
MNFWIEWTLAVHRALWFPLNWTLGLERPGIALPVEFAPAIAGAIEGPPPPLTIIEGGLSDTTAPCERTRRQRTVGRTKKRATK